MLAEINYLSAALQTGAADESLVTNRIAELRRELIQLEGTDVGHRLVTETILARQDWLATGLQRQLAPALPSTGTTSTAVVLANSALAVLATSNGTGFGGGHAVLLPTPDAQAAQPLTMTGPVTSMTHLSRKKVNTVRPICNITCVMSEMS